MTARDAPRADPADRPAGKFRLALGGYLGACFAALAATGTLLALPDASSALLAGTGLAGLVAGATLGALLADRGRGLALRLASSRRHRLAYVLPAAPFALAALASVFVAGVGARLRLATAAAALAIALAGYALSLLAANRYVDAVTGDEPLATYPWTPPGSAKLDLGFAGAGVAFGVGHAVGGRWLSALWWASVGLLWIGASVLEGRWPRSAGRCELRVYETGIVRARPYAETFVSWSDVDHVRLREDELVFDRGLFDLSFDRDELEDPDAVLAAVERAYSGVVIR